MPITIKELLASDTISQASDKVNFNFDQLLLNGGGPVGPPGPLGPPGPIGGRGIRGSHWYEDPSGAAGTLLDPGDDPNTIPSLLPNAIANDNYLQANGEVWEYNGSVWIDTGVNLQGEQGIPGTSEDWRRFGAPPTLNAGNNVLTPVMPSTIPTIPAGTVDNNIFPVSLGGMPESIFGVANGYAIDTNIAQNMTSGNGAFGASLYIHVPGAPDHINAIKFSGANQASPDDYCFDEENLATVGLDIGDRLVIQDSQKVPVSLANIYGLELKTFNKNMFMNIGKGLDLRTGMTSLATLPAQTSEIKLWVTQKTPLQVGESDIILLNDETGLITRAEFRVGTTNTTVTSTNTANIWGSSARTYFNVNETFRVFNPTSSWSSSAIDLQALAGGGRFQVGKGLYLSGNWQLDIDSLSGPVTIDAGTSIRATATTYVLLESNNGYINLRAYGTGDDVVVEAEDTIWLGYWDSTLGHIGDAQSVQMRVSNSIYGLAGNTIGWQATNGDITLSGNNGDLIETFYNGNFNGDYGFSYDLKLGLNGQGDCTVDNEWGEIILKTTTSGGLGVNNNSIFLQAKRQDVGQPNGIGIQMVETDRPGSSLSVGHSWGKANVAIGDGIATNTTENPDNSLWVEEYLGIGAHPQNNGLVSTSYVTNPQATIYADGTGKTNYGQTTLLVVNDNIDTSGSHGTFTSEMNVGINTFMDGSVAINHGNMIGHRIDLRNTYTGIAVGSQRDYGTYMYLRPSGGGLTNRNTSGFYCADNSTGNIGRCFESYSYAFSGKVTHGIYTAGEDFNYHDGNVCVAGGGPRSTAGSIGVSTSPTTEQYAPVKTPDYPLCVIANAGSYGVTNPLTGTVTTPAGYPALVHFRNQSGLNETGVLLLSCGNGNVDKSDMKYIQFTSVNGGGTVNKYDGAITGKSTGAGILFDTASDARLKTKIKDWDGGLDMVMNLRPRTFEWKEHPGVNNIGLIAQEVREIYPDVVSSNDENGYLGLDYGTFTPLLIGAVQKQQQMIEEKDERIKSLEDRLKAIEEKLGL